MNRRRRFVLFMAGILFTCSQLKAQPPDLQEKRATLRVLLHAHSLVSPEGKTSLQAIASLARKQGIDAIVPTDHFVLRWGYGLNPLPGILRRTINRSSVLKFGIEPYLSIVDKARRANPNMLILPGVEITPATYWTGHPAAGTLTLREADRHLLIFGLEDANILAKVPVAENPKIRKVRWKSLLTPGIVIILGSVLMLRWPAGLLVLALGLFWAWNQRPFQRPPELFETLSRNGYDAAQTAINYVDSAGGLSVWAHPEAGDEVPRRLFRSLHQQTRPYPEAVFETVSHAGFGFFPDGQATVGSIGGIWDQCLSQYARGKRDRPFWAFAELAGYGDGYNLEQTGAYNELWAKAKTNEDVLEAFRTGRFYAAQRLNGLEASLHRWEVRLNDKSFVSGETAPWSSGARIKLSVELSMPERKRTRGGVIVIRNGVLWKHLPFEHGWRGEISLPKPEVDQTDFYRLLVVHGDSTLLASNPIFVRNDGHNF